MTRYCFIFFLFQRPSLLSAGLFLPSVFLVAVVYAGCNHILIVTFLTLSMTTGGFSAAGVFINQIDIAPRWVSSSKQLIKFLLLNSLNPENVKHIKAANHLSELYIDNRSPQI